MYYNSANSYFKKRFLGKVHKLALDIGCTCPNRDGTLSDKGCIFCLGGSGNFAQMGTDINEQIERAKRFIVNKCDNDAGYIAYFQAYTNTYGDIEQIKKYFVTAARRKDILALSIGTRPDCLGDEVINMLKAVNEIKPIFVELGLQTSNEATAALINRCYKNEAYVEGVKRLKEIGAEVITHIILGLPGETREDMLKTVKFAVENKTDGIKLQLLHVLKGTQLAQMSFNILTQEEYISILADCVRHIPQNVVLHRITGDGDKKALIAPKWSANKHAVLNAINSYFKENNVIQGSETENGQNKSI